MFTLGHTACAVVVICPVAAGQIGIGNSRPGIGGVNELAVPGINANMGNAAGIGICKEDDVTGFQVVLGDGSTMLILVSGGAVGGIAQLLENIVNKTGAVKAGGRCAAIDIRGTQILLCLCQDLSSGHAGHRRIAGRTGGCHSVQSGSTGGSAGGLAAPEELRAVGGILIFIGDLRQVNEVAADIADGRIVNHFIPAIVQTQNIALAAFGCSSNATMAGRGAGTEINTGAVNLAITQFSIFPGENIQIIRMHVTNLQVVIDLVPVSVLADHHNTVVFGCSIQNFGISSGVTAKP